MTKEVLALALTVLVHVIGMAALVWALLLDDDNRPDWRGWWPGGDDEPPAPPPPARAATGCRCATPSPARCACASTAGWPTGIRARRAVRRMRRSASPCASAERS